LKNLFFNEMNQNKLKVILDMETQDPDDYLTLLLLLGHPQVDLQAITITPGSTYQVGLVRQTLQLFDKDIPVGAFNINHPKTCVSPWHEEAYGAIVPSQDAQIGAEVLYQYCDENTTLITGAPLKNLGKALDYPDFRLGRLVAQGGFAGEGVVVPSQNQLEKFKGKVTCPTFNLNGDIHSAFKALASNQINERYFVSKNVCHGVYYDAQMHELLAQQPQKSQALQMIYQGMDIFLNKKFSFKKSDDAIIGKKLHDPLAACCAIDLSIGAWAEVEMFRSKGEWGSRLQANTRTWIITAYNHAKFLAVFMK
jgi:inosine-uridine nucleoside N-ribohydrolase